MNTKLLVTKLGKQFPKRIAKDNNDFVGLMCGKLKEETKTIVLCLDFDDVVYERMMKDGVKPDLILTHHPFIYGTRKYVLEHDPVKRELFHKMEKLDIPIYSIHTPFDTGKGGMNDALMEALEMEDIHQDETEPMMRVGTLKEEMEVHDFVRYVKEKLHLTYGLLVHSGADTVKQVSLIAGGGSREWVIAKANGSDIYISGDAPHHMRRDVVLNNFNYLDLPHEIERIFMPTMKKILLGFDSSLNIVCYDHEELPELV